MAVLHRKQESSNIRIVLLIPDIALALMNYLEARKASGEVLELKSPLFIAVDIGRGSKTVAAWDTIDCG